MATPATSIDGFYSPFGSREFGPALLQVIDTSLRATMRCGDELLVTPDLFEDSSARRTQGERDISEKWSKQSYIYRA